MKLFLRSHAVLILLFLLQGLFVFFYYWFAGLHSFSHLFYILGVQLLILAGYLAYRWYKDRGVYHWLSSGQEGTDIPYLGSSVFCSELYEKQMELIRLQHQKLHETEAKLDARVTYMNQWVHQVKTPLSVINLIIQEEDEPVFEQIKKKSGRLNSGWRRFFILQGSTCLNGILKSKRFPCPSFSNQLFKAINDFLFNIAFIRK